MKIKVEICAKLKRPYGYKEFDVPVDAPPEFLDDAIDITWDTIKKALGDQIIGAHVKVFYECPISIFDDVSRLKHINGERLI